MSSISGNRFNGIVTKDSQQSSTLVRKLVNTNKVYTNVLRGNKMQNGNITSAEGTFTNLDIVGAFTTTVVPEIPFYPLITDQQLDGVTINTTAKYITIDNIDSTFTNAAEFSVPNILAGIRVNFSNLGNGANTGTITFSIADPATGTPLAGTATSFPITATTVNNGGIATYMLDTELAANTAFIIQVISDVANNDDFIAEVYGIVYGTPV